MEYAQNYDKFSLSLKRGVTSLPLFDGSVPYVHGSTYIKHADSFFLPRGRTSTIFFIFLVYSKVNLPFNIIYYSDNNHNYFNNTIIIK